jgi:hypothetical protein
MKIWIVTSSSDCYADVWTQAFTDLSAAREAFDESEMIDGDLTQVTLWVFDTATGKTEEVETSILDPNEDDDVTGEEGED